MKYKKVILSVFLFFLVSAVEGGEEMRGVVNIGHLQSKDKDDVKYQRTAVGFSFFFTPVKKTGNPWLEAPFLERTSDLRIEVGPHSFKYPEGDKSDGLIYDITGIYASKSQPMIAGATYGYYDFDSDVAALGIAETESNSYGVLLGAYLSEGTAIYGTFRKTDYDSKWNFIDGSTFDGGFKSDTYSINLKHVQILEDRQAFGVTLGYMIDDEEDNDGASAKDKYFYISPSFYLNNRNNISLDFSSSSGDSTSIEGKRIGVGFHSFVTNNLSFGLNYSQFDAKNDPGDDDKTWVIDAAWWF